MILQDHGTYKNDLNSSAGAQIITADNFRSVAPDGKQKFDSPLVFDLLILVTLSLSLTGFP